MVLKFFTLAAACLTELMKQLLMTEVSSKQNSSYENSFCGGLTLKMSYVTTVCEIRNCVRGGGEVVWC